MRIEINGEHESDTGKLINMKLDANVLTIKMRLTDEEAKTWGAGEAEHVLILKPKSPPSEAP